MLRQGHTIVAQPFFAHLPNHCCLALIQSQVNLVSCVNLDSDPTRLLERTTMVGCVKMDEKSEFHDLQLLVTELTPGLVC